MSEFGKNLGALDNGYLDAGLTVKGADLLCAGIIKRAYLDLIEAYLADAAVEFHEKSYNCAMYYETLRKSRKVYQGFEGVKPRSMQQIQIVARKDIEKLDKWFRYSESCRMYLRKAQGVWFAEIAKKHAIEFALDKRSKAECIPVELGVKDKARRARMRKKWKAERDAWRREHGLNEVKDD